MNHRDELARVERDARELIVYADGVEEGLPGFSARSRVTARDALQLVEELRAERSARIALKESRDRCLAMLLKRTAPTLAAIEVERAA